MTHSIELAQRFRAVIFDGTWIANTNYRQQLADMSCITAITRFQSLHSIAILAQHIHYYFSGIRHVLKGCRLEIKDKYSFDFPPIASQSDWQDFVTKFFDDAAVFASLVEQMPEQKLTEVFVEERYGTYQRNIDGMIEHSYYHLGQIVLIRKLMAKQG